MSQVLIIMGSDSDIPVMNKAVDALKLFDITFEMRISSAHRTPDRTHTIIKDFTGDVIIVGAGAAAHLAGVVAAYTVKPVVAVPINATPLNGVDALYATVQMPSGIPVATMAINGAKNAAIFAANILALSDDNLNEKLLTYRKTMAEAVYKKDADLSTKLQKEH
ncbi:5-(carboxyamino)imidazole ribonucleotide mutase [bacterium]|nr:5-(carboxyamino)imidazole ribonucleotide mutase [bacterium]